MRTRICYVEKPGESGRSLVPLSTSAMPDEDSLQGFLYKNPSAIPIEAFDTDFGELIPVAREMPVPHGYVDLVCVSTRGRVAIIETKLWRNPEAHREVVAQVFDYAKDIAKWSYREFADHVLQARKGMGLTTSLEEELKPFLGCDRVGQITFEANLTDALAEGRLVLLVIGDRVHPNIVMLGEAIQGAPHLAFNLGFVEMHFYSLSEDAAGPQIVVPDVVGRTVEKERAVIRLFYEGKKPEVEVEPAADAVEKAPRKSRISAAVYLAKIPAEFRLVFQEYFDRWTSLGFVLWFGQGGFSVRVHLGGKPASFFWSYYWVVNVMTERLAQKLGFPEDLFAAAYASPIRERLPKVHGVMLSSNQYAEVKFDEISETELRDLLAIVTTFGQRCAEREAREEA